MRVGRQQQNPERTRRGALPSLLPLFPPVRTLLFLLLWPIGVPADVAPVAVRVAETKAWVGQRIPFFVELRAPGSFEGSASFDLPEIPGTLLMKIGNPVVGSQEMDGESWFVQTHEFALFSQKVGVLEVPAFAVRFSRREGFVGPATEVRTQTPPIRVEIQRPAGSGQIGFLVTTESLEVSEAWNPAPGPTQVGAMFKRTIIQRAPNLPGMALAPAPTTAPDGIRVYPGNADTNDQLDRGDFRGERRETITYLLQEPGTLTLPALSYVWWNPTTEKLQSQTLPAVTFQVASLPMADAPPATDTFPRVRAWLLGVMLLLGLGVWQRSRIIAWGTQCWKKLRPPDQKAARQLLRACHRHDAAAAHTAWVEWQDTLDMATTQGPGASLSFPAFQPSPDLRVAILGLQRHLFGPGPTAQWRGERLARAFSKDLAAAKARIPCEHVCVLPLINPRT